MIGTRSFGSDPQLVARHAVAYVRGLHSAGMIACAKHFPGHGDTSVDSHFGLPRVDGDLEPHLVPFRAVDGGGRRLRPHRPHRLRCVRRPSGDAEPPDRH